ncbi:ABC transporter ATP-binding protein/permease [Shewanella algicola]|uniref:Ribosome-associated ATPase/putative transporter RbbA n=1 Tax=Shewanella algicola TaxID=640633 RepID=A0A9X1Z648_9GAMM|nr:ribosome-associated ATPase/putative transporter RbbA [Shewanella algicola]MCL1104504.1 ribosome-associated ATPase/putative transporter RbbA [Shewanella algicola]GGP43339.1 ABC transporter ATP-binding protein/permease [Shewanella algicola]
MDQQHNPIVCINNVSHRYKKVMAIDDVTLSIPSGQMVGLLGPDGVGKSTLLALISGVRKLQSGNLEVLGGDMASALHRSNVGPRIAYMPQGLGKNLYSELSVAENLDFFGKLFGQGSSERKTRIDRLTHATGLNAFLSRPAGKLSGGMKQKLGLCCSLIHDPDLLILDEPTTGGDPLSRRQFWQLINTIRSERPSMSVIVSTAYMDEAEGFDWLVAMDAGHVLDSGTPEALKTKTQSENIEQTFTRLLPKEKRGSGHALVIPPFEKTDASPAITAKGLTRRFGDFTAVSNVSFDIQAGEIFGFLGSNGCGKTTTMKMLTGLLPASEGEAFLFGKLVDADNIDMRNRVGFMSQAFSLYGELTVKQNLTLHARLFHLSASKATERIDVLVDRFGLRKQMDDLASSLPLGIRQRLSLAVAVIHEPEMLILDEPTSGVDPVARDEFWELLVELSRRDKVTIFISTHFMNEALRCDRISLMHAGEVLVYDEPQHLVEAKGSTSLEEAFISYLEDAIGQPPQKQAQLEIAPTSELTTLTQSQPQHAKRFGFNLSRLLAYSYLEMMAVMRDKIRLAFAFFGSVILLIVIAYGISLDIEDLTFAVLDYDQTPQSREYVSHFQGSHYFIERPVLQSKDELERRLQSNDITLAIEIPAGFGRDIKKGQTAHVSAWIDGANTTRAGTIEGYVTGGYIWYLTQLATESGVDASALYNVDLQSRYRYNPSFESIYSIGPKTPALLLLFFPAILMAVSIAREKEVGTITNFFVTPTNKYEFLIGKQLPYIAIGMINFFILTFLVVFLLQVPLKGSLLGLTVGAFCYVCASTGIGLVVSSVTKTQVTAVFATTIVSLLPTALFSGLVQPTSTLEGGGYIIGMAWPATYYMHLSVAAFTKGLHFFDLTGDIMMLSIYGPILVVLAAACLKKQEA